MPNRAGKKAKAEPGPMAPADYQDYPHKEKTTMSVTLDGLPKIQPLGELFDTNPLEGRVGAGRTRQPTPWDDQIPELVDTGERAVAFETEEQATVARDQLANAINWFTASDGSKYGLDKKLVPHPADGDSGDKRVLVFKVRSTRQVRTRKARTDGSGAVEALTPEAATAE